MVQRRLADIDGRNFGVAVHVCENRRLVGAAAGNQNIKVGFVIPVGPQDAVRVAGVEPLPIALAPRIEILDGFGVGPFLVLAGDNIAPWVVLYLGASSFGVGPRRILLGHGGHEADAAP